MNLYRIILVDDEEEVRQSIIKKIDWEDAGFSVVGDAENGQEALEKVEALEPDVILTDIRMPYMDGLSLAERVRQRYPSIKIVIFSGYDEFEYAKQAIKLNVTEYILKPVNVEELTAILKRIKSNLDEEIEQKRNVSLLRENYRRNLPILREQFLNELVGGTASSQNMEERLMEYHIPLAGAKKWVAAAIDIGKEALGAGRELPLHRERDLIPISVKQLFGEKLEQYCRCAVFTSSRASGSELALIAAIDGENSQTGLIDVLGDICKEIRKILEVPVTVGIGHSCQDLKDIGGSYKSAMDALGYKAIVGAGGTIYINDVEPVSSGLLRFDSRAEAALMAAVKFGPREQIEEAVRAVVDKMIDAKVHFSQCQAYMLSISSSMIQMIQQYELDITQLSEGDAADTFAIIPKMVKVEDFSRWLLSMALHINQAMNQERDNTMKQVIQKAKEYIMENYQDPDLSVEKICRQLHLSPAYFSTMFKKETGQAYIAYLTQVRLDKAVELLNKTDDKTYVIAAKVGYQEQNYFSYVFKKRFGISPTKFRGAK
ncbi:MAG: response regulator [Clostridiaceae bacterium]|uniref:Stage 0 sporulation protein A homolog n=1 Tax=Clostridium porci TaxID=2605778 RepID=A0A7X2NHY4_9CLOT|nr:MULTISPECIES: response regulator [Clostridium]MCI6139437.1 response regulator [Clostridium sp.]MDU3395594.1 response regulator [Clostridiales bacterium]MDY3231705.1 response regulator [Clostridiaceae bacterium]MSS35222.1 response regulator [Clostridium porci]